MSNWQAAAPAPPQQFGFNLTGMTGVAIAGDAVNTFVPVGYTELVAALPFDCEQIELQVSVHLEEEIGCRLWMSVGAAGSERDVLEGIIVSLSGQNSGRITLPLFLPRGARLALKHHEVNTARTLYFSARVWPRRIGTPMPPVFWRNTFTGPVWQSGATVAVGSQAYGAWTELMASTPFPVRWLGRNNAGSGNGGTRNQTAARYAIGAASSERVVWDAGPTGSAFFGQSSGATLLVAPVPTIPAGSRLSGSYAHLPAASSTVDNLFIGY